MCESHTYHRLDELTLHLHRSYFFSDADAFLYLGSLDRLLVNAGEGMFGFSPTAHC